MFLGLLLYVRQPYYVLAEMKRGMMAAHPELWQNISPKLPKEILMLLTPTSEKVLNMIYDPDYRTSTQQQTFDYLRRFINQLSTENLGKFLQFVTGTPQCALQHVKIVFNSTGESFARRPVASTCSMS